MKLRPHIVFDLLVLLFFAYLVWEARDWRIQARLYPWVIGIPMLIIAAVHLGVEVRGAHKKKVSKEQPVDIEFAKGMDPVLVRWRTITIFSWILGFLAGLWLVGFAITIPLVVFLYLKVYSREGWVLSLVLTGAAWLLFWGLFDRTLRLPFPDGQIYLWMGL